MKRLFHLTVVISALSPGVASALVELQGVEPNPAIAGQNINLLVRVGLCDRVEDSPTVSVNDDDIDVLIPGDRLPATFPCVRPIIDHEFSLGVLESGDYIVTVRYDSIAGGAETIGTLPLTVIMAQPVPAGGWLNFLLLIISILAVGGFVMRNRVVCCTKEAS